MVIETFLYDHQVISSVCHVIEGESVCHVTHTACHMTLLVFSQSLSHSIVISSDNLCRASWLSWEPCGATIVLTSARRGASSVVVIVTIAMVIIVPAILVLLDMV